MHARQRPANDDDARDYRADHDDRPQSEAKGAYTGLAPQEEPKAVPSKARRLRCYRLQELQAERLSIKRTMAFVCVHFTKPSNGTLAFIGMEVDVTCRPKPEAVREPRKEPGNERVSARGNPSSN